MGIIEGIVAEHNPFDFNIETDPLVTCGCGLRLHYAEYPEHLDQVIRDWFIVVNRPRMTLDQAKAFVRSQVGYDSPDGAAGRRYGAQIIAASEAVARASIH